MSRRNAKPTETRVLPPQSGSSSFLVEETATMDRQRRLREQEGHRQHFGVPVRARDHEDKPRAEGNELDEQQIAHPILDTPKFAGADLNMQALPWLDPEAKRELENLQRELKLKLQQRLGLTNEKSFNPVPPVA